MNKEFKKFLVMAFCLVFLLNFFSLAQATVQQKSSKKININTASLAELQKLPRVGAKIAQRIIDYRKQHGPFKRIEDIMKVRGIGEKTFLKLKDQITVGSSK